MRADGVVRRLGTGWRRLRRSAVPMLGAAAVIVLAPGCGREEEFTWSQDTPEEVLASAKEMVLAGRAELLTELIYAEDERMRLLYRQAGRILGSLQDLAEVVAERFPTEISRIERLAEEAAKKPTARRGSPMSRGPQLFQRFGESDDPINDAVQSVLADPYGWLTTESDKLTTVVVNDSMVAVLRDGKPILPPLGLVIEKKDDDRWYVIAPTSLPWVQRMLPKTDEEFQIWMSLLQVVDNALVDLTKDIETGRINSLDRAVEEVGKKFATTAPLVIFAYSRAQDAREEKNEDDGAS
ncbi:MAG: hypothetical protein ACF8SC_05580 [Phycisphaerales bacterium JB037]